MPPTRSELEQNVAHVAYEMAAMERAAELTPRGGRFRFEAFLLHARLMREFLWGRSDARGPGRCLRLFQWPCSSRPSQRSSTNRRRLPSRQGDQGNSGVFPSSTATTSRTTQLMFAIAVRVRLARCGSSRALGRPVSG